jgi:hypothetical protein
VTALGPSPFAIDTDSARGFLGALAPGEAAFTFQTFDDTDAKRRNLARVIHGAFDEACSELTRLSALGAGVFMTANRTDLKGRREANVIAVRALFVVSTDRRYPISTGSGCQPIFSLRLVRSGSIFIG